MTGLGPTSGHACPFLKSVFSNENHELSLMRDQLPEEIWGLLADLPPKILNASFVDENLRNSQADPLMEVEMASGDPTFAYILVEHKSYQDAEAVLQMIGYMVRIWRNYIQEGTGEEGCATRARSLLPIIPLPGYSCAEPWKGPTCPADMMEIDAPKLTFLHGPNLILWQWAQMSPEELSRDPVPLAGLITLIGRALVYLDRIEKALLDNPDLQNPVSSRKRNTRPSSQ